MQSPMYLAKSKSILVRLTSHLYFFQSTAFHISLFLRSFSTGKQCIDVPNQAIISAWKLYFSLEINKLKSTKIHIGTDTQLVSSKSMHSPLMRKAQFQRVQNIRYLKV